MPSTKTGRLEKPQDMALGRKSPDESSSERATTCCLDCQI